MLGDDIVIADPDGAIAERLGLKHGGRVVVRPDGYMAPSPHLTTPRQTATTSPGLRANPVYTNNIDIQALVSVMTVWHRSVPCGAVVGP
jgi:hypothetical protein